MSLDSYFYMNMEIPEENRVMECYCVDCFEKLKLENGMFWEGSTRGYGDFDFKCLKCGLSIHLEGSDDNSESIE